MQVNGAICPLGPGGPCPASQGSTALPPSSCFLPDGNSLPILLLLLSPVQHRHMSAQRQPEGLGKVDLTMGAALLQTLHMARGFRLLRTGPS